MDNSGKKRRDAAESEAKVLVALARGPLCWSKLRDATHLSKGPLLRTLRALEGQYVWQHPMSGEWNLLIGGFEYLRMLEGKRNHGRLEGEDQKRLSAYRRLCPRGIDLSQYPIPTCVPVRDRISTVVIDTSKTVTMSGVAVIHDCLLYTSDAADE